MGKTFHGPFRITDSQIKISNDGDFYVMFDDENGNVLGAIFTYERLREITRSITSAMLHASAKAPPSDFAQGAVETHVE